MKSWFKHRAYPLVLLPALLLILFWDVISSGMIFGSDISFEFLGNRAFGFGEMKNGQIPLWNPYQFCGYDFLGSFQSGLLYPLNQIFTYFSIHFAFVLSTFVHLLLTGIFGYIFVERLTKSKTSGLITALVLMLNTHLLGRVYAGHITVITGFPWLVFSYACFCWGVIHSSWRWALLASVGFALQIYAGFPQLVYLCGFGLFIFSITYTNPLRNLLYLAMSGFIGMLLSSAQLIPAYLSSQYTSRALGVNYDFSMSGSFAPENFLTYLSPHFFGDIASSPYWGRWFLWEVMPYTGVFSVMVLCLSFKVKDRLARSFCAVALATILMTLGKYASYYPSLFEYVPGVYFFRGPARMLMSYSFAMAVLAGLSLQFFKTQPKLLTQAWKICLVLASLFVGVGIILHIEGGDSFFWKVLVSKVISFGDHYTSGTNTYPPSFFLKTFDQSISSIWMSVFWLITTGLILLYGSKKGTRGSFGTLILILLTLDLVWAGSRFIAPAPQEPDRFAPSLIAKIKENTAYPRIVTATQTQDLAKGSVDHISHVGGYDAGMPLCYMEYMNTHLGRPSEETLVISESAKPGKMLKMMGVTHVISSKKAPYPNSKKIGSYGGQDVYELLNPLPRAYLVADYQVISDKKKRLSRLNEASFKPEKTVILEKDLGIKLKPSQTKVSFLNYENERVVLQAETSERNLLVLTDTYSPFWKVYVDGVQKELLCANHMFRAVLIEPGQHKVEFKYSRKIFYASSKISLVGLVLLLGLIIFPWKRRAK